MGVQGYMDLPQICTLSVSTALVSDDQDCNIRATESTYGGQGYDTSTVVESAQECVLACIRNEDCDLVSVTNLAFGLYCFVYKQEGYSPVQDPDAVTYHKQCQPKPGMSVHPNQV